MGWKFSAQELLQGVCHSGLLPHPPWGHGCSWSGFGTGMSHGHCESAAAAYTNADRLAGWCILVLYSSVFPNCLHLCRLFILFCSSHFIHLPTSSLSPRSFHLTALLAICWFSLGCFCFWGSGFQATVQLLNPLLSLKWALHLTEFVL